MPVAIDVGAGAVEIDGDLDVGLLGGALDGRLAHREFSGARRAPLSGFGALRQAAVRNLHCRVIKS